MTAFYKITLELNSPDPNLDKPEPKKENIGLNTNKQITHLPFYQIQPSRPG